MMATPAPTALDVTDLKFKLQNKVPVFGGDGNVRDGCCLLAAASVHGLVFVGTTGPQLRVLQLSSLTPDKVIDEIVPVRTVPLPSEPFQLAVSCDNGLLAVDVVVGGVPFVYVYSVPSFLTPTVAKVYEIRTSPEGGVRSTQIVWNPVIGNMFSLRTENGGLSVYTLKEGSSGFEFHSLDKAEGAICACWSPKGKQLVVGFANGKLAQYKPDLKLARTIVCPAGVMEGAFDVIAVQWLSTYQFAAVFMPKSEDSVPSLFIVNAPKVGNPVYINYDDICYSQSGPRKGQVFLVHILQWNLLLMASANSMEVGILGTTETGETPTWCQWSTTDEARAELPLSADKQETFPAGLALETGCKHQVVVGEETLPVMPMLHMVSTYGLLVSFNILNLTPNVPNICSPPRPVNDTSGQFERIDFSKPVAPQPVAAAAAAPPAAEISFALPTGATSTPALATKSKSFFSPSEPKTSTNLFGATTQPTFGKPLTFGGFTAPSTTAEPVKTSPFAGTPAFGGFGAPAQPAAAQPSLLKQTTTKPAPAPEPTKPFVTVPPTYTPPATELARSGSSSSLAQQQQKAAPKKSVEPSEDTNSVIRTMISEEIRKFEKELENLRNRCKSQSIAIGTKEESATIIRDLKELQDLSVQATESTESLISDVQALRLGLNEAFAMVAEANSKNGIFKHPSPNQFQETHAMSQSSRRQLASLQNNLAINENQLQIVNKQLDAQWSAIQEASRANSRRRMHVPSLEVLYQTLSKQQEILNRQRDKISGLKGKLGLRENIRGLEKSRRKADLSGENGTSAAIDSLTDSIVAMNIGEKIRADAQRMTDAKMDALRKVLSQRKVITIKPGRPDRVGLNSEVVRERRNEARRLNQEKTKQPAKPAVKKVEEPPKPAKPVQQPQPKPVPTKAPEAATPKFELPKTALPSFAPKPTPAPTPTAAAKPAASGGAFSFAAPSATAAATTKPSIPTFGSTATAPVFSFGPSSATPFGQVAKPKEPEAPKETTLFGTTTIKPIQATVAPQKPKEKTEPSAQPPPAYGFSSSLTIQPIPKESTPAEPAKPAVLAFGSNNNNNNGGTAAKPAFSFGSKEPVSFGVPTPTPALNLTKEKENEQAKPADKPAEPAAPAESEPPKSAFPALTNLLQKVDPAKPDASKPPTLFGSVTKTTTASSIFGTSSTATIAPGTGLFGSIKPAPTTTSTSGGLFAGVSFGSSATSTAASTTTVESSVGSATTTSTLFGSIKPVSATATTTTSSGFSFGFGSAATAATTTTAASAKPTDLSVKPEVAKAETAEEVKPAAPTATTTSTAPVAAVSSTASSTTTTPSVVSTTTPATTTASQTSATPAPSSTTTTTDATSNLFGSFNICSPSTTPPETSKPAASANIFGSTAFSTPKSSETTSIFGTSTDAKPVSAFGSVAPAATQGTGLFGSVTANAGSTGTGGSSIFGGGSPFGGAAATASTTPTAGTGLFGSITPATSPVAPAASTGSIFGGASTASPFGAAPTSTTPAASSGSIFGGASAGGAPSGGGLFGSVGASPAAATGGSIFGGSSAFGSANTSSGNIFGSASTGAGFGTSAFGQPASPAPAQSIFGGGATSTPAFGSSSFGSPAPAGGGAFSQPVGGSVATTGFGSPTASAFNKPAFGGTPTFGGAPTFGGTPTFGGSPAFGAKPAFGSPPPVSGGFGQAAASPSSPSNNLFEQLGSSSQGVSFGGLAQQSAQKPAQFGGSSFSSWR